MTDESATTPGDAPSASASMIGRCLVTGLGTGYAPVASGTFGSAAAIGVAVIVWSLHRASGVPDSVLDLTWLILTVLSVVGCVRWSPWAIATYNKTARKQDDPGEVVLDEWAGQFIALVALPMVTWPDMAAVMAVQFFLFRVFDVIKPPPGRRLEKLPAGWGIALDDVAAGVYANVAGQVFFRFILPALTGS
jgi:phosphatidylglycerophosphatase A